MLIEMALLSLCIVKGTFSSCEVLKTPEGRMVRCEGTQLESLREDLQYVTEDVSILEFYNISIDALPDDAFSFLNASLRRIVFTLASLEHLQVSYSFPFLPFKYSLESFEVYRSSNVFGWNFSSLASMSKLHTLIVENSEIVELSDFRAPSVQFIQLIDTGISWIHPHAFEMNENLTICSLSKNSISRLKRSMFPKPATHLWSLDFSFNKLETLPKDMFTDMNSLHELKLDNNQLTRIGPSILTPIWSNLSQLWLDGNKEVCWPFCSLVKKKTPMFMDSSKCRFRSKSSEFILFDSFYKYCQGKQLKTVDEMLWS